MKLKYIKPVAEIVNVRLYSGVLDDEIGVGGQSQRTKPSESLGNENSMFDADEEGEPQYSRYQLWEWDY